MTPHSAVLNRATKQKRWPHRREPIFIGVVSGNSQEAEDWKKGHQTPYPVIADPTGTIAKSFGAERSAYTALVTDGKTMHQLWRGYSAAMLSDLSSKLATTAGIAVRPLNTDGAPKTLTSGCPLEIDRVTSDSGRTTPQLP
jgi:hypothetical protein